MTTLLAARDRLLVLAALALPAGPLAAQVATELDVDAVVEHAGRALGTSSPASAEGTLRIDGTCDELGVESAFELVEAGDGRFLRTTDGALGQTFAFDGENAWQVNFARTPRVLELGDREGALAATWLLTGWWASGRAPLEFRLVPADDSLVALDWSMVDGLSGGRIELDAATFLPRRLTYPWEQSVQELTVEAWRSREGLSLPAEVRIVSAEGVETRYELERFELVGELDPARFAWPPPPPADASFDPRAHADLGAERIATGHLVVHAALEGRDDVGVFFFDTGAGVSCLSTPVALELGLDPIGLVTAVGIGGATEACFFRPESLRLGPVTLDEPVLGGIDLSFIQNALGRKVAGIVGYDLIARCVVELDAAAGRIALHDPSTYVLEGGDWQPLILYGGHPHVEAGFEGHRGVFKIDTGATGTVTFHAPTVRALGLLDGRETSESVSGGVGGTVPTRSGTLAWFELGGRRFESPEVEFALEDRGAFGDPYLAGNMGNAFLQPFVVVLDYGSRRIAFLEKE